MSVDSETTPLLTRDGDECDEVPKSKRTISLASAILLIFNRVAGTSIFATPSLILFASGSVGLALVLWVLGALITVAGLTVYIELGTGLPRSGGELTYLSFIYTKPKYLVVMAYTVYAACIPWTVGSSTVFGEYILRALFYPVNQWNQRCLALSCVTFALCVHVISIKWGLRIQNALGIFKILVLVLISFSGLFALAGLGRLRDLPEEQRPRNFEHIWEGTNVSPNAFVTGLYSVIWSFIGYSNVNYALSEVRNPVRTVKIAGPIAIASVTLVYLFINVAYFAAVSKEEIIHSKQTIAALYFRNMFGPQAEQALSVFVALSALGNVMSVLFTHGRLNQELGRLGFLPFSHIFASNDPFNTPGAGLVLHWFVSSVVIVAVPPGDAYNFVLNLASYPYAIINFFISIGLIYLRIRTRTSTSSSSTHGTHRSWQPPYSSPTLLLFLFALSNLFLILAPLVPPLPNLVPYAHIPYWLHVAVSVGVFTLGMAYWLLWAKVLPRRGRYRVVREEVVMQDGIKRDVFRRVPVERGS